jgi:ubiquinone/menaquinone biosynthesis C-methylase UbiE
MTNRLYSRTKARLAAQTLESAVQEINQAISRGSFLDAIDLIETLCDLAPHLSTRLLAQAYDILQQLPDKESHFALYQSRFFEFPIRAGDTVLDIGSGHLPFPMATHLADFATEDGHYGRAGAPFKFVQGKPVYNCSVEEMPFMDGAFDFVYCSHVLEHVSDPIKACRELMRVAKRGYLETPTRAKDLFLNTAKISNHRWMVEYFNDRLVFSEYSNDQIEGLRNDLLMSMHCSPETEREKAFAALILIKSDQVNTMLTWEGGFDVEVRWRGREPEVFTWKPSSVPGVAPNEDCLSGAIQLFC